MKRFLFLALVVVLAGCYEQGDCITVVTGDNTTFDAEVEIWNFDHRLIRIGDKVFTAYSFTAVYDCKTPFPGTSQPPKVSTRRTKQ